MKSGTLVNIASVASDSIRFDRKEEYLNQKAVVVPPLYEKVTWLLLLTGPRAGSREFFNNAAHVFQTCNAAEAVRLGELCMCRGVKLIHSPGVAGCLSEEEPPFCGKCGKPCEAHSYTAYDPDEFAGVPCSRPYPVTASSCCDCDELYEDPSLLTYYQE